MFMTIRNCFYLSTQRSRNKELGYAGHLGSCVRIQLDGKKIMEKYSGKPIDYWGASMGFYQLNKNLRKFTKIHYFF